MEDCRHAKHQVFAIGFKRDRSAGDKARGYHARWQGRKFEGITFPSVDKQINLIGFTCGDTPRTGQPGASARAVNRLTIQLKPIAEFE